METGVATTIHQFHHLPDHHFRLSRERAIDLVKRFIQRAVMHELDECLLVDGVQLSDPHAGERR